MTKATGFRLEAGNLGALLTPTREIAHFVPASSHHPGEIVSERNGDPALQKWLRRRNARIRILLRQEVPQVLDGFSDTISVIPAFHFFTHRSNLSPSRIGFLALI